MNSIIPNLVNDYLLKFAIDRTIIGMAELLMRT